MTRIGPSSLDRSADLHHPMPVVRGRRSCSSVVYSLQQLHACRTAYGESAGSMVSAVGAAVVAAAVGGGPARMATSESIHASKCPLSVCTLDQRLPGTHRTVRPCNHVCPANNRAGASASLPAGAAVLPVVGCPGIEVQMHLG